MNTMTVNRPKQEVAQATAPAPRSDTVALMAIIERASADPSTNVDNLQKMWAMYEHAVERDLERDFNNAMATAQSELRQIAVDSANPQTRSRYASYGALDKAVRPIYSRHGLSLTFDTGDAPAEHVRVVAHVAKGGFSREYHIDMPADGKGAKGGDVMTRTHATGSAVTYGRRYLLSMIFNLAVGEGDDDGNAAADTNGHISPEQLAALRELITRTKAVEKKFLTYMGVEKLEDIKARFFQKGHDALVKFERTNTAKGTAR